VIEVGLTDADRLLNLLHTDMKDDPSYPGISDYGSDKKRLGSACPGISDYSSDKWKLGSACPGISDYGSDKRNSVLPVLASVITVQIKETDGNINKGICG